MKKIITWFVKLDNLAYTLYIEEITKGNYKTLHKFCSWIGLPFPLFTMLFAIAGTGYFLIGSKSFLVVVIAYLISSILNLFIKALYKRTRPLNNNFWSPIPFDEYSFPSGHAAGTMAVAFCLSSFAPNLTVVLFPWSILMGISRFLGDFHHPTDVLSGFLVGIISGYVVINLLSRFILF